MNKKIYFTTLALLIIIFSGCTQHDRQEEKDLASFYALYNQYAESAAINDVDGIMETWDENGIRSEPGFPSIIGKEKIRARFEEIMDTTLSHKITPLGDPIIEMGDDLGFSYRTFNIATTIKTTGEKFQMDYNVLTIFKKQTDGSWKILIDCLNEHPSWTMDTIPKEIEKDNPYY